VWDSSKTKAEIPDVREVLQHVEHAFKKPRTIDTLTFSGNGEPTLHPDFLEIVQGVVKLRNNLRPEVSLAIFSNASQVNDPEIFEALQLFDAAMMKLDAGNENTFQVINRPAKDVQFSKIVSGLKRFPSLMIQSMLIAGSISNAEGKAYEDLATQLRELNPREVHVYSIARPPALEDIEAVSPNRLKMIAADLNTRFHLNAKGFY